VEGAELGLPQKIGLARFDVAKEQRYRMNLGGSPATGSQC